MDDLVPPAPVRVEYAHICDWATVDFRGKLVLGGIFDAVHPVDPKSIQVPPHFFVCTLHAQAWAGSDHRISVKLEEADGPVVAEISAGLVQLQPHPRQVLQGSVLLQVAPYSLSKFGEYVYRIYVDGGPPLYELPLTVAPLPVAGG